MMRRKIVADGLQIRLTSAELEESLQEIILSGIGIASLRWENQLSCVFHIRYTDLEKIQKICARRGEAMAPLKRYGWFFRISAIRKRGVLVAGLLFLLLMTLYLPTRVLFIAVEGNVDLPSRQILEAAEDCGIRFGASRRYVRSEKVKNELLSALPQLKWAGVTTRGCVATISVREGVVTEKDSPENQVSSIVAARDGCILGGTVTKGTGLFQPGQTVKKGEILISGYTDCGLSIQATRAEGEVFAQTKHEIRVSLLMEKRSITEETVIGRKISLLIRKKRINLWKDSGISGDSCGRMYKEYCITLPGDLLLPVALCVEECIGYDLKSDALTEEEAALRLALFAKEYLLGQMLAGKIENGHEKIIAEGSVCHLTGAYVCSEMIGREQQEQIGDINGKNN